MAVGHDGTPQGIAKALEAVRNPQQYTPEQQRMISELMKVQSAAAAPKPISPIWVASQGSRPKLSIIDATVAYREAAKDRLTETELVQRLEGELDRAKDALANAERRFRDAKEDLLRTAADEQADIL